MKRNSGVETFIGEKFIHSRGIHKTFIRPSDAKPDSIWLSHNLWLSKG